MQRAEVVLSIQLAAQTVIVGENVGKYQFYNLLYCELASPITTFEIHGLVKKRIILENVIHLSPARS